MRFEVVRKNKDEVVFKFEGVPYFYLNAIRRYALGGIPVYAIDRVVFYDNTSSFYDEYIAHRLGQIPIRVRGNIKEEELGFTLDEEGPKKVYSSSLNPNRKELEVVYDNIPIVTLGEGQAVRLECKIKKDVGRKHAKFQAAICSYNIEEQEEDLAKGEMFIETLHHYSLKEVWEKIFEEIEKDLDDFINSLEESLEKK